MGVDKIDPKEESVRPTGIGCGVRTSKIEIFKGVALTDIEDYRQALSLNNR